MSTKFFYALVLTLATIVLQLLLFFSGFQTEKLATGQYLQWLGLVIMAVVLWLGIKAVRDEKPDRPMTYGQRVGTGVLISLYSGLMGAVYTFIHFTFINTGFADYTIALTREKWAARGLTQAQMEGAEAITRKMLQPGVQAILGVFFAVLIGLILSLIIAALVKEKARAEADLKHLAAKDEKAPGQRLQGEESQGREPAKRPYGEVIEKSASSWPYNFADLRDALSIAEERSDLSPELLSPLLTIYQRAVEATHWGADRSDEQWMHIERFERSGARKQFEESSIIKEASLRVIEKAGTQVGSGPVLAGLRSAMEKKQDSYDPLVDDTAHDIAARRSYSVAVDLIDRLMKS